MCGLHAGPGFTFPDAFQRLGTRCPDSAEVHNDNIRAREGWGSSQIASH